MKKIFSLFLFAFVFISASAQKQLIDDPNAEPRKLSGSFHGIAVSSAIDLYLTQGNEEAIAVSADDKRDITKISTEIENGVLVIKYVNAGHISWFRGNKKLKAYVSFKNIDRLSASGASDVYIQGTITGDKLDIHLSGASDLKGAVKVSDLSMEQSGASDASISGSATNATINVSGASDVKAYDFVTENCTAKASGSSDIHITVNKELNVHASGASDIYYKGTAVIKELHSSGSSSVSKKG